MPHGEHDLEEAFSRAFAEEGVPLSDSVRVALSRGLVKAVEFAAERATANLAQFTRRRLVVTTAVLTAIIVSAIAIPVTYVITNEGRVRNCHLITKIAKVERDRQREEVQQQKTFQEKSQDRFGLTQTEFENLLRKNELREARRLAVYEEVAHSAC